MPTFHFVLRNSKQRKNGEIPIYLRITAQRKYRVLSTGIAIEEKYWNANLEQVRKSHPNSDAFNARLEKILVNARNIALNLQNVLGEEPAAKTVKEAIEGRDREQFFPYAEDYYKKIVKRDKYWQRRVLKPVIDKLREFAGGDLLFEDITSQFLMEFETFLRVKHENNQNTIYKNLSNLRRVIKQAVKDQVIPMQDNPFLNYKLRKGKAKKEKLSWEEIQKLENVDLPKGSNPWHSRNYFIFSFYCAGIRFTDLCDMRWKNFKNGRLQYKMSKTGQNKNVKLLPQAKQILAFYKPHEMNEDARIFPILPSTKEYPTTTAFQRAIDSKNTVVNENLRKAAKVAGVETHVSTHIARHSFADFARKQGMDLYSLSKALGHSSLTMTEQYLKSFDEETVDEAFEEIFQNPSKDAQH